MIVGGIYFYHLNINMINLSADYVCHLLKEEII